MHSCAKSCARINVNDYFILILRLYIFPGRDNQHVIYGKLMEIFFPVIDPVHILCLGFFDP